MPSPWETIAQDFLAAEGAFRRKVVEPAGSSFTDFYKKRRKSLEQALGAIPSEVARSVTPVVPWDERAVGRRLVEGGIKAVNVATESIWAQFPPEVQASLSVPFEGLQRGFTNIVKRDIDVRPGVLDMPGDYRESLRENRPLNEASRGVLRDLLTAGIKPKEAYDLLNENFEARPLSSQIASSVIDPGLMVGGVKAGVGAARLGVRGVRAGAGSLQRAAAPAEAAVLRRLGQPVLATPAGRVMRPRVAGAGPEAGGAEDLLDQALRAVYERPQSGTKPSVLAREFGQETVDALRERGFVSGGAAFDSPLGVTITGRERFGAIPSNVRRGVKRNREFFKAVVEITGTTFKPPGAVGKEIVRGDRYFIEVEFPVSQFRNQASTQTLYASVDDAIARNRLAGVAKEPWQMTAEEFTSGMSGMELRRALMRPISDPRNHYAQIKQALLEGKPVPPEVLAEWDFSDLTELLVGTGRLDDTSETLLQAAAAKGFDVAQARRAAKALADDDGALKPGIAHVAEALQYQMPEEAKLALLRAAAQHPDDINLADQARRLRIADAAGKPVPPEMAPRTALAGAAKAAGDVPHVERNISAALGGRRSMRFADLVDNEGNRFKLSLIPDPSTAGTYSVVARLPKGTRSWRMQYSGSGSLTEARKHFEDYINIDAPPGTTYRVESLAVRQAPAQAGPRTFDQTLRLRISEIERQAHKSRGDEITLSRMKATLQANPSRWQIGQGVGWRAVRGQVNRGYRIEAVIPETKEAIIRPVGDIGQLADYTGQSERVDIIDLLRDRRFDATQPPVPLVEVTPPVARPALAGAAKEPWQMTFSEFVHAESLREKGIAIISGRNVARDHELLVKQALFEGKPVPPEVLAEYPDLAAKAPSGMAPRTAAQGGFGIGEAPQQVGMELGGRGAPLQPLIPPEGVAAQAEKARLLREGQAAMPEAETARTISAQALPGPETAKIVPVEAPRALPEAVAGEGPMPGESMVDWSQRIQRESEAAESPASRIEQAEQALYEAAASLEAILEQRKIVRPPRYLKGWGVLSNEQLRAIAAHEGLDPYDPDWYDGVDSTVIREVRQSGTKVTRSAELNQAHLKVEEAEGELRRIAQELEKAPDMPSRRRGRALRAQAELGDARRAVSSAKGPAARGRARKRAKQARVEQSLAEKDAADVAATAQTATAGGRLPPTGRPPVDLASASDSEIVRWFGEFVDDPARLSDYVDVEALRRAERHRRFTNLENRVEELIEQGYPLEEAMRMGRQELAGPLPSLTTLIARDITPRVREALVRELYFQLATDGAEQVATHTALVNALAGKAPPSKPGTAGMSALARLQKVYGERVTKAITAGKPLQRVIELQTSQYLPLGKVLPQRGAPLPPFPEMPSTQTFGAARMRGGKQVFGELPTERLAPEPGALAAPQTPMFPEKPLGPFVALPPDTATAAEKAIFRQAFKQLVEGRVPGITPAQIARLRALPERELFEEIRRLSPPGPWVEMPSTQVFGGAPTQRMIPEAALAEGPQPPMFPEKAPGPFVELPPDFRTPAERAIYRNAFKMLMEGRAPGISAEEAQRILRLPENEMFAEMRRLALPGPWVEMPTARFGEVTQQPFPSAHAETPILEAPQQNLIPEPSMPEYASLVPEAWLSKMPDGLTPGAQSRWISEQREYRRILDSELFRRQVSETDKERMVRWAKDAAMTPVDFGNLIRANMASVDLSYLRQQAFLIPGNPAAFAHSFRDALRAMWSDAYARNSDDAIKSDPFYKYSEGGPAFLRELDSPLAKAWEREEQFLILGGQRPLQRLARKMVWLTISNRAFVTGINSMNWAIYKGHLRMLFRHNEQIAAGLRKGSIMSEAQIKRSADHMARMLADFSGRGPLGPLTEASPILNNLVFSVRMNIGRLLMPRHLIVGDRWSRQAAWKNMLSAIGVYGGLILGGREMGLWDVETDPRSSDFMKIKIGRIRIDPWGGGQQFAILYGRLLPVMGGIKLGSTGEITDYDFATGVARFSRTKAAPLVDKVLQAWFATDFKGTPIERKDWKRWLRESAPFTVQDIIEAFAAEGLTGLFAAIPGIVGAGVTAHELTLNDVAKDLYGVEYDNIPTTGGGAQARERIRKELERRRNPREKRSEAEAEERTKRRAEERKKRREEAWTGRPGQAPAPSQVAPQPARPAGPKVAPVRVLPQLSGATIAALGRYWYEEVALDAPALADLRRVFQADQKASGFSDFEQWLLGLKAAVAP